MGAAFSAQPTWQLGARGAVHRVGKRGGRSGPFMSTLLSPATAGAVWAEENSFDSGSKALLGNATNEQQVAQALHLWVLWSLGVGSVAGAPWGS